MKTVQSTGFISHNFDQLAAPFIILCSDLIMDFLVLAESKARCEYLQLGPSALDRESACTDVILFTPGNPGQLAFYPTFLRKLHELLPEFTVLGCGLPGHCGRNLNNGRVFSLEDQITMRVELVLHLHSMHPSARVYLCAHSIGAYISQQTIKRLSAAHPSVPIGRCVFICPALRDIAKQAGLGKRIAGTWGVRHVIAACAGGLGLLPTGVQDKLVSACGPSTPDCEGSVRNMLRYSAVSNLMWMFVGECAAVRGLDKEAVAAQAHVTYIYSSRVDHWAPTEHMMDVRAVLAGNDAAAVGVGVGVGTEAPGAMEAGTRTGMETEELVVEACASSCAGVDERVRTLDIEHAFCLRQSDVTAQAVADAIRGGR